MMNYRTGHTAVMIAAGLELNTYPAGAEELKATPEAMRAIAMDAPK